MDRQPSDSPRKPLVTVEFQTEVDVATGGRQRRMFVKMYFDARHSGLLAAIPGELWKMLCCLATYMNEDGNCYPTQDQIAHDLGIRRQRVNERIQDLLNFRFQGQPVLSLNPKLVSAVAGATKSTTSRQFRRSKSSIKSRLPPCPDFRTWLQNAPPCPLLRTPL